MTRNAKIEKRIRALVATKAQVRITGKTRSRSGFWVVSPIPGVKPYKAKTKQEALAHLLLQLRLYCPKIWGVFQGDVTWKEVRDETGH